MRAEKLAFKLTVGIGLITPRQLGPTSLTPASLHMATILFSISRPSPPTSLKPADINENATATHVALAFPSSNYDPLSSSNNKVWVGTEHHVYYVNCKSSSATTKVLGDFNVWSLAYKGSPSSGTLAVGQAEDLNVPTTTEISTESATFVDSSNEVTGGGPDSNGATNTLVKFSPAADALYAGTYADDASTNDTYSELAISTDYSIAASRLFSLLSGNGA